MKPRFTLDPREADAYVRKLAPRRELVYRLALRSLCDRCRGDRVFKARTDELLSRYRSEIDAVLAEADELSRSLNGDVKKKPRQ